MRVFQYHSDLKEWVQLGGDVVGEGGGDYFGQSVARSSDGTILAVGAPQNDGKNGDVSGE